MWLTKGVLKKEIDGNICDHNLSCITAVKIGLLEVKDSHRLPLARC